MIASRILRFRKAAGWSRQELAMSLGMNVSTVRRWELGLREPHCSDLFRLSDAFGITVAVLIGEEKGSIDDADLSNDGC